MVIVATIFTQSSTTYLVGTDRLTIYSTARAAVDLLAMDMNGCLPVENDQQRYEMGEEKVGAHMVDARDWISFRATAPVNNEMKGCEVKYSLVAETDPSIIAEGSEQGVAKTVRTKRQLYVLRRETKDFDGVVLDKTDLCHYVLSFNIECFDSTDKKFKQLNELTFTYPIGDANPTDEKLPRGLRVTLRVVAGAAERQERLITRVIWIPMGQ
ncbi:MAG: hypothetical protein HY762_09010, partial [Planctomycetes bacterium]|nr:hypothetical protein [Planctomycetota bacterium]